MRFYRRCYILDRDGWATTDRDGDQDGTVTVSDVNVYQGLAATNALIDAPDTPVTPVNPGNTGNENENTGNENTGNENTGNQNNNNSNTGNTNNKNDKTETTKDTTAATDVVTEAKTDAETKADDKTLAFGCDGTIGLGSAVLLMASFAGVMGMAFKKKED